MVDSMIVVFSEETVSVVEAVVVVLAPAAAGVVVAVVVQGVSFADFVARVESVTEQDFGWECLFAN